MDLQHQRDLLRKALHDLVMEPASYTRRAALEALAETAERDCEERGDTDCQDDTCTACPVYLECELDCPHGDGQACMNRDTWDACDIRRMTCN